MSDFVTGNHIMLWRFITIVAATLLIVTAEATADTWAVVIGVNAAPHYRLADGGIPRPLQGAETDARRVAQLLQTTAATPDDHLQLLVGKTAHYQAVRNAFEKIARLAGSSDTVLIHFSGHGTQVEDSLPFDEDDGLDETLCLHDAQSNGQGLLRDDELGQLIDKLAVADVLVVLDCCHAGTGTKDDDADLAARYLPQVGLHARPRQVAKRAAWRELSPATKSLTRSTTAYFACRPDQQAYERRLPGENARVGQFSHFFWRGIADRSADIDRNGTVTRREAIEHATKRLEETFNRSRPDAAAQQSPTSEIDRPERPIPGFSWLK